MVCPVAYFQSFRLVSLRRCLPGDAVATPKAIEDRREGWPTRWVSAGSDQSAEMPVRCRDRLKDNILSNIGDVQVKRLLAVPYTRPLQKSSFDFDAGLNRLF